MSLQIWLPLNGNVDNQGLSDLTFSVVSTNTTVNDSGKIGKCYENNSFTAGGLLSDKTIDLGQNQSMFCWFKINSLRSNSSLGGGLVTQHNHTLNQGMGITIRYVSATTGYLSVSTGNGTSRTYNAYYGNTLLQAGTWYHGGYTYDGTTIRLYVNGALDGSFEYSNMKVEPDYIYIFRWSLPTTSYSFDGCLNDVRIYDNVLSPREIKEISKALLLHFPLSCPGGENLMINTAEPDVSSAAKFPRLVGQTANTALSVGTQTVAEHGIRTTITSERRPVIRFGSSSTTAGTMNGLEPGQTYTLSFDASWRALSGTLDNANTYYFRAYLYCYTDEKGVFANTHFYTIGAVTPDDRGTEMSGRCEFTFTIPDDATKVFFVVQMNISTASAYAAGDYTELRNIKLENGTKATIWCPAPSEDAYSNMGYDDTIEYDVSGYGYNGIHNNVAWSGDSPRYNGCYELNGTNSYIRIDSGNWKVMGAEELTINEWAYADDWTTQTNAHLWSCTESGGFNTENGDAGKLRFPIHVYTNAEKTTHDYINIGSADSIIGTAQVGTATIAANVVGFVISDLAPGWHMFTGVYNTSGIKTYIDGVLKESENTTSYGVYYSNAALFLGAESAGAVSCIAPYFNGKLSDFRMYYTALTDSDILALYNTPISLSNTGTLLTQGEYQE